MKPDYDTLINWHKWVYACDGTILKADSLMAKQETYGNLIELTTYPDMTDYDTGAENYDYDSTLRLFSVPEAWAQDWLDKMMKQDPDSIQEIDIDNFLGVYDWDLSYGMYECARMDGVVISEEIIKR